MTSNTVDGRRQPTLTATAAKTRRRLTGTPGKPGPQDRPTRRGRSDPAATARPTCPAAARPSSPQAQTSVAAKTVRADNSPR